MTSSPTVTSKRLPPKDPVVGAYWNRSTPRSSTTAAWSRRGISDASRSAESCTTALDDVFAGRQPSGDALATTGDFVTGEPGTA